MVTRTFPDFSSLCVPLDMLPTPQPLANIVKFVLITTYRLFRLSGFL